MRHIKASEFKAKCLELLESVHTTGESVTVTRKGVPIVELRAVKRSKRRKSLFGIGKGEIEIIGDIVNPIPGIWKLDPLLDVQEPGSRKAKRERPPARKALLK